MFITNNHDLFHQWWKENLVTHLKVSKYYDHECMENFLWLLMSLLIARIVKSSHILAGAHCIFQEKYPTQNLEGFW